MIFILLFKGRVLEKGHTGWAAWIGIWEVRVQFLPLLPAVRATLGGHSLPSLTHTHTGLRFLFCKKWEPEDCTGFFLF